MSSEPKPASRAGLTEVVYPVPEELKPELLVALLERGEIDQTVVLTRTKHRANRLMDFVRRRGITGERVHGGRSQKQRSDAVAAFREGGVRVLVSTDLAVCGMSPEEVGSVVHFDVPRSPEGYVRRSEDGTVTLTLLSAEDVPPLRAIEKAAGESLPEARLEDFDYEAAPGELLEEPAPAESKPATRPAEPRGRRNGREESPARGRRRKRGTDRERRRQAGGPPAAKPRLRAAFDDDSPPPPGAHLASHLGPRFAAAPSPRDNWNRSWPEEEGGEEEASAEPRPRNPTHVPAAFRRRSR